MVSQVIFQTTYETSNYNATKSVLNSIDSWSRELLKCELEYSFVLVLQNCPIRTKYLFDTVFWLAVFFQSKHSIYLIVFWLAVFSNQNTVFIWYSVMIGCFFQSEQSIYLIQCQCNDWLFFFSIKAQYIFDTV